MESQFLDEQLRDMINSVTAETLEPVKQKLQTAMVQGGKFNKGKHLIEVAKCQSPKKLQHLYYNYILAAEGGKVL